MKLNATLSVLVASLTMAVSADAAINLVSFLNWRQNLNAAANRTYDASGFDKLVVVVTGEHNFGGNLSGNTSNITYNGQALTKAVEVNPVAFSNVDPVGHGQTASDIWYLDNPGAFTGTNQIIVTFVGNNWVATAIGLTGTATGVSTTASATRTSTIDLTTTAADSFVIATYGMGGNGNTANATVGANAPLTKLTGQVIGSNWAGHNIGTATVATASTAAYSFNNANLDTTMVALTFAPIPEPSALALLGLGGFALLRRRRP
jgi:hypothetical protein